MLNFMERTDRGGGGGVAGSLSNFTKGIYPMLLKLLEIARVQPTSVLQSARRLFVLSKCSTRNSQGTLKFLL